MKRGWKIVLILPLLGHLLWAGTNLHGWMAQVSKTVDRRNWIAYKAQILRWEKSAADPDFEKKIGEFEDLPRGLHHLALRSLAASNEWELQGVENLTPQLATTLRLGLESALQMSPLRIGDFRTKSDYEGISVELEMKFHRADWSNLSVLVPRLSRFNGWSLDSIGIEEPDGKFPQLVAVWRIADGSLRR